MIKKLLGDRVAVKKVGVVDRKTKSGIIIPKDIETDQGSDDSYMATVEIIGDEFDDEHIKKGDTIIVEKRQYDSGGELYGDMLIIDSYRIAGKVE